MKELITCKICKSSNVIRYGNYKGSQRYLCKSCLRKFKPDNVLFNMQLPSEMVIDTLNMYYRGYRIGEIREHINDNYKYLPSKPIIYRWINKYTSLAANQLADIHPDVGITWIIDETPFDIDGNLRVKIYDFIDDKTRFLLSSMVAINYKSSDMKLLFQQAIRCANCLPSDIVTFKKNPDFKNEIFSGATELEVRNEIISDETDDLLDRFLGIVPEEENKVIRSFRNINILKNFVAGWPIYYNFLRPNELFSGRTPAETAGLGPKYNTWKDIIFKAYK